MANDLLRGRQTAISLTNKSGGGVVAGDVVILDSANASAFKTTTTSGFVAAVIGVAIETIANNAAGRICTGGYVPLINLNSSASLYDFVKTHTVAKQATHQSTIDTGTFGQVLGTGSTPPCWLFGGLPYQASLTNPMTTQDDLIVAGSAGSPTRLGKGSDSQVLTVDPSTHHLVWATPASGDTTAKYVIGAADAGLANALVIPAFVGHPDIKPASPDAMDDEFDAGSLDVKWTAVNMSTVVTDTYASSNAIFALNNSAVQIRGVYQGSVTTGTWRTKFCLNGIMVNNMTAGLWLMESGSSKCLTFSSMWNSGWQYRADRWTATTTFSANASQSGSGLSFFTGYLELQIDSTNVTLRVSTNGVKFEQFYQEAKTASFTTAPNRIGIFVSGFNGSGAFDACFDFFRKVA